MRKKISIMLSCLCSYGWEHVYSTAVILKQISTYSCKCVALKGFQQEGRKVTLIVSKTWLLSKVFPKSFLFSMNINHILHKGIMLSTKEIRHRHNPEISTVCSFKFFYAPKFYNLNFFIIWKNILVYSWT